MQRFGSEVLRRGREFVVNWIGVIPRGILHLGILEGNNVLAVRKLSLLTKCRKAKECAYLCYGCHAWPVGIVRKCNIINRGAPTVQVVLCGLVRQFLTVLWVTLIGIVDREFVVATKRNQYSCPHHY
jgi:hypothetical protein